MFALNLHRLRGHEIKVEKNTHAKYSRHYALAFHLVNTDKLNINKQGAFVLIKGV